MIIIRSSVIIFFLIVQSYLLVLNIFQETIIKNATIIFCNVFAQFWAHKKNPCQLNRSAGK